MNLTQAEKEGCCDILRLLETEDVFALAKTITKNTIKITSRSEAERAILSFAESADDLLNRKKLTKEVLLNYVFSLGLSVPQTDKDGLKAFIINHWNKQALSRQLALKSPPVPQSSNFLPSLTSAKSPPPVYNVNQTFNINVNFSNASSSVSQGAGNHHSDSNQALADAENNERFAHEFVKWFYRLLNSHNPWQGVQAENFGPEHFVNNAQLHLVLATSVSQNQETINGSEPIVQRLLIFPRDNLLFFNPNISSEGVHIKSDPHGLKLILVCGTLHRENNCSGIFKQSFGLIRNPYAPDSWQVKVICLKMDEQVTQGLPQLKQFGEVQAMEGHTIKVLQESLPNI